MAGERYVKRADLMARKYGRLHVNVWGDKDYRALTLADQGLFCGLLAYPQVSWCGIIDFIPSRLEKLADEMDRKSLGAGLQRLIESDFLSFDGETDELWIRRFMFYDGVLQVQNMGKAMVAAYNAVNSEYLQGRIVAELARIYTAEPKLKGWDGVMQIDPDFYDEIVNEATC